MTVSNPRDLFSPIGGLQGRGRAGTVGEAATFGDVVVVSIPFYAYRDLPPEAFSGKIVIDTMNYFPAHDDRVAEIDSGATTSSQLLARPAGCLRLR